MKGLSTFSFIYGVLALLDLIMIWCYPELRWITKPLIVLSLIFHFYQNISDWSTVKKLFLAGLVVALIGDIFLLFEGDQFFLFGLGGFLIMQILYGISFYNDSFQISKKKMLFAVFLVVALVLFMRHIWNSLESMSIPVLIYSIFIWSMVFFASTREKGKKGYSLVLVGALLFMMSDGLIAWSKFYIPLKYGGLMIMFTYTVAQYLITTGFLKSLKLSKARRH